MFYISYYIFKLWMIKKIFEMPASIHAIRLSIEFCTRSEMPDILQIVPNPFRILSRRSSILFTDVFVEYIIDFKWPQK